MRYFLVTTFPTFCAASIAFFGIFCGFASADPFTIGISAPLTGALAEYGTAVKNGFELAAKENPLGFVNIQFAYEDNQYAAPKGIAALRRLQEIHGARVIYQWGEPVLYATAPIAERERIPLIAMSVDPTPSLGREFTIRSINPASDFASVLLAHLRRQKLSSVGVISVEDPYMESLADGLRKSIRPGERVETLATHHPEDNDFQTEIIKLKKRPVDAVALYLLPGQVSTYFRQAQHLGMRMPTLGTDVFESEAEIRNAEGGMRDAVYANLKIPETFATSYHRVYGNSSQVTHAYNAYCVARLIAGKFNGTTEINLRPSDIIATLKNIDERGQSGFVFRKTQDGGNFYEFPMVLRVIKRLSAEDLPASSAESVVH